jgi:EAL domain-containing protein (putative c-di-GMP-specific phosphodiesterase class I)
MQCKAYSMIFCYNFSIQTQLFWYVSKFLTLEILENNKIQDIELFQKRIDELKNMNIKIAVDDFGTEYNNLDYLLVLKPDFLKIDGSIVKEIKSNEYSIKIIESIVILAQKLNVKTVAEFVEDKESFNIYLNFTYFRYNINI